jgi:hypothetical protein
MNEKKCKCGGCKCDNKDEGGMGGPKPYSTEEPWSDDEGGMGGPKGYDRPASNEPYRDDEGGMGGPKGY